jgi:hypothetical protein
MAVGISPKGVMRPVTEARLLGRTNGVRVELDWPVCEARLLGRLNESVVAVPVADFVPMVAPEKPKLRRLAERGGSLLILLFVLALTRLRAERTVTVDGMVVKAGLLLRGDERGGVDGAGSLERVVWTRSSNFCIRPINPLI